MTNDEKILQLLEGLQADVKGLKQGQQEQGAAIGRLEQGQQQNQTILAQLKTAVEALDASQQAHRSEMNMRLRP